MVYMNGTSNVYQYSFLSRLTVHVNLNILYVLPICLLKLSHLRAFVQVDTFCNISFLQDILSDIDTVYSNYTPSASIVTILMSLVQLYAIAL